MLKVVRWLLGRIILLLNWLTQPASPRRTSSEQSAIDASARHLQLYEFRACPFCVKVRRELKRLGVNIAQRDAARDPIYKQQLIDGGGKHKVPCLRINQDAAGEQWLYESDAIIAYLRQEFASVTTSKS